jgi:hypothetical protein
VTERAKLSPHDESEREKIQRRDRQKRNAMIKLGTVSKREKEKMRESGDRKRNIQTGWERKVTAKEVEEERRGERGGKIEWRGYRVEGI